VRHGIALITEDRKGEGLLLPQPIAANVSLGNIGSVARHGVVDAKRENALAQKQIEAMRIRSSGPGQIVGELSGGNQQKVVIGRWLARDCRVLLFDEPTRGIDVGAKAEIFALIGKLVEEGAAVLLISSELPEIVHVCDRAYVMREGTVAGHLGRDQLSEENLLALGMHDA